MNTFQIVCSVITVIGLLFAIAFMAAANWFRAESDRIHAGTPSRRGDPLWVRVICMIGRI